MLASFGPFNGGAYSGTQNIDINPLEPFSLTFIGVINHPNSVNTIGFDGAILPIPEPATMLLFGTGLIRLAGLGRKKFFVK